MSKKAKKVTVNKVIETPEVEPTRKQKQRALALAFGVTTHDNMLHGIPGGVPMLGKALTCNTCEYKLVDGVPEKMAPYMTEEQKQIFKEALAKELE